jgi:hypothetical protein
MHVVHTGFPPTPVPRLARPYTDPAVRFTPNPWDGMDRGHAVWLLGGSDLWTVSFVVDVGEEGHDVADPDDVAVGINRMVDGELLYTVRCMSEVVPAHLYAEASRGRHTMRYSQYDYRADGDYSRDPSGRHAAHGGL